MARCCGSVCEFQQLVEIGVDGEAWHPPDTLAQDPYHGANVEELHPTARGLQIDHREPRPLSLGRLLLRVPAVRPIRERAHEELRQLDCRPRPNMLPEVAAPVTKRAVR